MAVASAVDVQERSDETLAATLAAKLRPRHALVILVNCEHLVEACAELVATVSTTCPRLHVLATSRVPLAVDGEATFELAGLPTPAPGASTQGAVATADAARLFELRARQVVPDFRIDEHNAPWVAEICRRLDGVPLAIEPAVVCIDDAEAREPIRCSIVLPGTSNATPSARSVRWTTPHRVAPPGSGARPLGLVDVKVATIDHDWSGLKFVRRRDCGRREGGQACTSTAVREPAARRAGSTRSRGRGSDRRGTSTGA